jgi:hypothetical protein
MNRHEFFPPPRCFRVLDRGDLTRSSRRELPRWRAARRDTPRINHAVSAFTENKRYQTNPQPIDDVVNRNAGFVYQTDAVLILIGVVQGR